MRAKMRYKSKYAILCRLVDCEEDWGLFLRGSDSKPQDGPYGDPVTFDSLREARVFMKADYALFAESYDAEWSANGRDPCRRKESKDEISIDVPIWDGENGRESWIHARWKIVKL